MKTLLAPQMLTFPARPVNGGRLELARPKFGAWFYEPKVNGWRALAHVPTRTAWNRHGEKLSIAGQFDAALAMLDEAGIEWADVEAIERRHALMRGCLFLLDLPADPGDYVARRRRMTTLVETFTGNFRAVNDLFVLPACETECATALYRTLIQTNADLGAEFYEGLVAKRATSIYPLQLRNSREEFPFWCKHRFV